MTTLAIRGMAISSPFVRFWVSVRAENKSVTFFASVEEIASSVPLWPGNMGVTLRMR